MRIGLIGKMIACFAALALMGCGQSESTSGEDAGSMTQQASETAQQSVTMAEQQLEELRADLDRLRGEISSMSAGLRSRMEVKTGQIDGSLKRAEETLAELREASVDELAGIESRFEALVDTTRRALDRASAEIDELEANAQKLDAISHPASVSGGAQTVPRDPETGLLLGLDEGEYDPYLAPVVEKVQIALKQHGLYIGEVDGYLDIETMKAIGLFQKENGIHMSGVPSPFTREELLGGGNNASMTS